MTKSEKELLALFKSVGQLTLEGNREYWTEMYYSDGKFCIKGGNTFPYTTDYRKNLTKQETLEKIREYLWREAGNWELSDEELVELWKKKDV